MRLLGVYLDTQLTGEWHVRVQEHKARKRLAVLKILGGKKWGASRRVMLTFYKQWERPVLEYRPQALLTFNKTALDRLERIQTECLKVCMVLPKRKSIVPLLLCSSGGSEPLLLRLLNLALRTGERWLRGDITEAVSYTHLRAHET